MMKRFTAPLLTVFFCTLLPSASAATPIRPPTLQVNLQEGMPVWGDFFVSPTRFVYAMNPGEERTVEMQITNRSGVIQDFKVTAEDFTANPDDGSPVFYDPELSTPYAARLWLTPETDRFQLLHGEVAFLRVKISVPANADAGDHQAAIMTMRVNPVNIQGGIGVSARMATLFIITVRGDVKQDANIASFWADRGIFWSMPAGLNLSVRNAGTVHVAPLGVIRIRNIFGVVVDEIPFEDWIVLRESTRVRHLPWHPRFALGRYTATPELVAFDGEVMQTPRAAFWVIPIIPTLIALLLIFLVSFLVQSFFQRYEIRRK